MYYVYFLKSLKYPSKTYVGRTSDLGQRLEVHNSGGSPHTAKYKPWKLVACVMLDSEEKVISFEQYIKIGSGYAFAKKRFW